MLCFTFGWFSFVVICGDIMSIDDCMNKVEVKSSNNGKDWLIVDEECEHCAYVGRIKIYYCR